MPLNITHDQWMKSTHSRIRPRSASLKRIDQAIQFRDQGETRRALIAWIDEQNNKRQDWQRSVRNEKGIVKKLYDELGILGAAPAFQSMGAEIADKAAKLEVRREQQIAAAKMFTGKEIKFKDSFWGISRMKCREQSGKIDRAKNAAKNVGKSALGVGANIGTAANTARGIASNLQTVIQEIMGELPAATHNEIIQQVFGNSIENFIFEVTPLIGMISSGGKATMDWVGVARNLVSAMQMEDRTQNVRAGDASAALQSMIAVIDRQIKKQTADGVIHTTAFSAKAAAAAADFGTATTAAIGVVESVAILLNTLVDIVTDAKQMVAGNKLIVEQKIDLDLFNTCPILGCYYIAVQDHSTIMNFEIANMGRDNWRQEAERLKYAIKPVLAKAAELISKSRIEIKGMEQAKGVYQSSLLQKIQLAYKSRGHGQSTKMAAVGSESFDIFEAYAKGEI
ncbi:MAG: hypothetical protein ABL984_08240 [Pyrinomonadaceae bacterium]